MNRTVAEKIRVIAVGARTDRSSEDFYLLPRDLTGLAEQAREHLPGRENFCWRSAGEGKYPDGTMVEPGVGL